jgi:predicted metal-dependent hydrolase
MLKLEKHEVKYVRSNVDGVEYLVRNIKDDPNDTQMAADMLGQIHLNINKFVDYVYNKRNDEGYVENKKYIEQLHERIKKTVISESDAKSEYTSFSLNKGEKIVICLRSKYDGKLHDMNMIMYVVTHEISHCGASKIGHGEEFRHVFSAFAKYAVEMGLYKKIDFASNPVEYCGITINESII